MKTHTIKDIEFQRGSYNTGVCLTYKADGQEINVTGEFYESDGIVQHTHEFEDGTAWNVLALVSNRLAVKHYPANFAIWGYSEKATAHPLGSDGLKRCSYTIDIDSCDGDAYDSLNEYIAAKKEELAGVFAIVSDDDFADFEAIASIHMSRYFDE